MIMFLLAGSGFYQNYDKLQSGMEPWIFDFVVVVMQVGPIPYVIFFILSAFFFRPYNPFKKKDKSLNQSTS